jgi:hypothetical protein
LATPAEAMTYTTTFPATEDPISEKGRWIGGKNTGLDWADFQSTSGLAFGKQSGTSPGLYDDSIALLTGAWGPEQTVEARVRTINQDDSIFEELELRLRSTITANSSTGYEVLFSARSSANAYVQIVRWNGPFADFTLINGAGGTTVALHDGDTIKATIVDSAITAYINGVQKLQVTDGTFATGNPGIGAYLQNAAGVNGDYGFTSVTASDGPERVSGLAGVRRGLDAVFSWRRDDAASGGYRLYRTSDKTLLGIARGGTTGVELAAATASDPGDVSASDLGVLAGPPAFPVLYYYQVVAVFAGGTEEGPN